MGNEEMEDKPELEFNSEYKSVIIVFERCCRYHSPMIEVDYLQYFKTVTYLMIKKK
jgi:hypothetical protein